MFIAVPLEDRANFLLKLDLIILANPANTITDGAIVRRLMAAHAIQGALTENDLKIVRDGVGES